MKKCIPLIPETSKNGVTLRHTAPIAAAKLFIVVTLLCQPFLSVGQVNLVPNGSFEDFYSCPTSNGQVDTCIGWYGMGWQGNPQDGTPDYFHVCATHPGAQVPINTSGEQWPFEGNAYMGIITYHKYFLWREIIGTTLLDTLIPGEEYHISIRVSRGNHTIQAWNIFASNNIGIRFTTFEHTIANAPAINNIAHVNCDTIITDTLNWILLQWNFIADSAYTNLYIGNFFDDANTDTITINAPYGIDGCECVTAYYYLDSLNVHCISQGCLTTIQNYPDIPNLISYYDNHININLNHNEIAEFYLYNIIGQQIFKRNIRGENKIKISGLPEGIYMAHMITSNHIYTQKLFINH